MDITIKLSKGEIMIMKTHTKRKLTMLNDHELKKRYHYLKSKLSPKADGDSNQMKYIKYHLRKRNVKV